MEIIVTSRVQATKDMRHNRCPFNPGFDIPKGTSGTVEEISSDGLRFYVRWDITHKLPHYRCLSSDVKLENAPQ